MNTLPMGVYPTMITPYTDDYKIDYLGVERLLNWYYQQGCKGVFALCSSSESALMSPDERIELIKFIGANNPGLKIVASGHFDADFSDQVKVLNAVAQSGAAAAVFLLKTLAINADDDCQVIDNIQKLMDNIDPDISLGIYEVGNNRIKKISKSVLQYCIDTNRFVFVKDTTCTLAGIKEKIDLSKGSGLHIYNANTTLLYDSLKIGAAGYTGMCGNYFPDLFVWLCQNYLNHPIEAERLSNYLGLMSCSADMNFQTGVHIYQNHYVTGILPISRTGRQKTEPPEEQYLKWNEELYFVSNELRKWLRTI